MFLETLFYNVKQPVNTFDTVPIEECNSNEISYGVPMKASFAGDSNVIASLYEGQVTFCFDNKVLRSTVPNHIYYVLPYQEKNKRTFYKLIDTASNSFGILEVEHDADGMFRSVFASVFIFTDFVTRYKMMPSNIGVRTDSHTQHVFSTNGPNRVRGKLFAECFDKHDLFERRLELLLFQSIQNMQRIGKTNMQFINYYETEFEFIIVHANGEYVLLEEFLEVFNRFDHRSFLFKGLFGQILSYMSKIDECGLALPYLNPGNILLTMASDFSHQAGRKKSTLRQTLDFSQLTENSENTLNKMIKQVLYILKLRTGKEASGDRSVDEGVLIDDISALIKVRFLNSVLLYPQAEAVEGKNSCQIGCTAVTFTSNYIQFFTSNTNCLVVGLMVLYFLTKQKLFLLPETFGSNKKQTHFFPFLTDSINKLSNADHELILAAFTFPLLADVCNYFFKEIMTIRVQNHSNQNKRQESYEMMTSQSDLSEDENAIEKRVSFDDQQNGRKSDNTNCTLRGSQITATNENATLGIKTGLLSVDDKRVSLMVHLNSDMQQSSKELEFEESSEEETLAKKFSKLRPLAPKQLNKLSSANRP